MEFETTADDAGLTLAAAVRNRQPGLSWNDARRLIERGKLFVNGERETNSARRLGPGLRIELRRDAPVPRIELAGRIVSESPEFVVFDKPPGLASVPVDPRDPDNAIDLIRRHWAQTGRWAAGAPLFVVHRIDKDTSGLIVFAKTKQAERALASQFRAHETGRTYLCAAHGRVRSGRIESWLVPDRGDGLKGSARRPGEGQRAVTHIRAIEDLPAATLCEVRLETGKTHQIRIHCAESGHPLVGERVYIRDFTAAGGKLLAASRLLLHAATLSFADPAGNRPVRLESPLPADFVRALQRLRG